MNTPSVRVMRRGSLTVTAVLGILVAVAALAYGCSAIGGDPDHLAQVTPAAAPKLTPGGSVPIVLTGYCVTGSSVCATLGGNAPINPTIRNVTANAISYLECKVIDQTDVVFTDPVTLGDLTKPDCPNLSVLGHTHSQSAIPCFSGTTLASSTAVIVGPNPIGATADPWTFEANGNLPVGSINRGRVTVCLKTGWLTISPSTANYWEWTYFNVI